MGKTKRGNPTSSSKAVGRSRGGKGGQNYHQKALCASRNPINQNALFHQ